MVCRRECCRFGDREITRATYFVYRIPSKFIKIIRKKEVCEHILLPSRGKKPSKKLKKIIDSFKLVDATSLGDCVTTQRYHEKRIRAGRNNNNNAYTYTYCYYSWVSCDIIIFRLAFSYICVYYNI